MWTQAARQAWRHPEWSSDGEQLLEWAAELLAEGNVFVARLTDRYTSSEASMIVRSVTGLDCRSGGVVETPRELQQNNFGTNIKGATRILVPETSKRRASGEMCDHAVGGEVESHYVRTRWRRKDPTLVENFGSVGKMFEGPEGADDDEAGRDRRQLREPQGKR